MPFGLGDLTFCLLRATSCSSYLMILLEDDLPALLAQQENPIASDYQMGLQVSPAEWFKNCILLRLIGVLVFKS